ncbi:acetyl-CoA carboxylase biotin carboxylase subunit [Dissulfurirhabdus thermomarina]|uniref:biotin carboxylase n=1 Tax=Dissulfurirhabdus thermomarina TaxID=1765737 RepID=A0A6N9TQJ7_DISTH|nr:biotin carboxylase N-terminal domain-containing protein [Dissulfurirhabdus thermomarina]NDY41717.1 acetyl-CoA carboxylase biotin carboxylase subunit [Dissulfurirhabdus thermomarina]NMX23203.1 acetyl-CoA carboxylase biotin carboxylase subunit [Dissulfurirhabdus thermomarina]
MSKDRILIANRGEIAIRIMQACRDLGLDFVVVYTKEDEESLHVRLAQEGAKGRRAWRISNYRDPNDIFAVADVAKCTAIHPGYGFFSENFRFARRATLRNRPLVFIGPRWEVIRDLGSKINTKRRARELDIPVIPGSDRPIYNEIEAEELARELFYLQEEQGLRQPSILVKASAGGGGMGIEEVTHLDTFRSVYRRIQNYAKRQFGDEGVLIEQCLRDYHHLEVQLLCSRHGEVVHFGTRNCTIQSTGRQKRVEVAPGFDAGTFEYPFDADRVLRAIVDYSVRLATEVGYDSVGTWEWIVTRDGRPYLLEVNTRIQVENEISARISRIRGKKDPPNLIREQIRTALGERLGYAQKDISFQGTCIELRIVAEDTRRGFAPWCGTITRFEHPEHPWLTVHSHVPRDRPYKIPTEYDPNLALAIVWGEDTPQAQERARRYLSEVVMEGEGPDGGSILVNLDYLRERLDDILQFR